MPDSVERYDAFIAYSHEADDSLAPALHLALERFATAWYERRAVRVFRDRTGLAASPDLMTSLDQALVRSRFLILLASPAAALSPWVSRELRSFLTHRTPDEVILVLTGGELVWDPSRERFSPESTALPPDLLDVFRQEPRWVDMRAVAQQRPVDPRSQPFVEGVADISAVLRGVSKDELVGTASHDDRRARRLVVATIVVLTTLLILSMTTSVVAFQQRSAAVGGGSDGLTVVLGGLLGVLGLGAGVPVALGVSRLVRLVLATRARMRNGRADRSGAATGTAVKATRSAEASEATQVADEVGDRIVSALRSVFLPRLDFYIGPVPADAKNETAVLARFIRNVGRRRAILGRLRVAVDPRDPGQPASVRSVRLARRARNYIFVCTQETLSSPAANVILQEWLAENPSQHLSIVLAEKLSAPRVSRLGSGPLTSETVVDLTMLYHPDRDRPHGLPAELRQPVTTLLSKMLRIEVHWLDKDKPHAIVRAARRRSRVEEPVRPWNLSSSLDFAGIVRKVALLPEVDEAARALGIGRRQLIAQIAAEQEQLVGADLATYAEVQLARFAKSAEREVAIRQGWDPTQHHRVARTVGGMALGVAAGMVLLGAPVPLPLVVDLATPLRVAVAVAALVAAPSLLLFGNSDAEVRRYNQVTRWYRRSRPTLVAQMSRHLENEVVLPRVRQQLNQSLTSSGTWAQLAPDATSLSSRLHDRFRLETPALREVVLRTQTPGGATIGLAGARGSGKTSIIQAICKSAHTRSPGHFGSQFGVIVPAPVEYQSEQFIGQVLATLCREILATGSVSSARGPYDHRPVRPGVRRLIPLGLVALCVVVFVAVNFGRPMSPLIYTNLGLVTVAVTCLCWAVASSRSASELRHLVFYSRGVADGMQVPKSAAGRRKGLATLAEIVMNWLFYTEEKSQESSATSPGSWGLGLSAKRSVTLAGKPWSTPELVHQFRNIATATTAAGHRLVIGIDELDKIEDDDKAVQLINDIKALFGVDDCYFVLSISLSAVAKFEQRGLPFQDAFESALDEVVRVDPIRAEEALELLQRRIIGIPANWVVACHVLGGGLPRDIIRLGRKLMSHMSQASRNPEVHLVQGEVQAKVRALETRCQLANRSPGEHIRFLRSLTHDAIDDEAWTSAVIDEVKGHPVSTDDPDGVLRTLVYTVWAATLVRFLASRSTWSDLNDDVLGRADRLADCRVFMSYDIEQAVSVLDDVRRELGAPGVAPVLGARH